MEPNELINRYVHAVGEHLPRKSRGDIQAELKSLLAEMLDTRAAEEGRPLDAAMTASVLREFGEPEQVAQRYAPQRPLLSPASSATFITVWKIVSAWVVVFAIATTVLAIFSSSREPQAIEQVLLNGFGSFVASMIGSIGVLGIIFYAMERLGTRSAQSGPAEKWDPLKLPAAENPNRLDRSEVIFTVVLNVFMLAVLNFAPNWLRTFGVSAAGLETGTFFGEAFFRFLQWLNVSFIIEIGLHLFVSTQGRWTRSTRIAEIASGGLSALIVGLVLSSNLPLAAQSQYEDLARLGVTVALIIVMIELINNIRRLITKRWNDTETKPEIGLVPNGQH